MEKSISGDLIEMLFEGEFVVENNSEVTDVWGGRQRRVSDGQTEVVSGFGVGFVTDDDDVQFIPV